MNRAGRSFYFDDFNKDILGFSTNKTVLLVSKQKFPVEIHQWAKNAIIGNFQILRLINKT